MTAADALGAVRELVDQLRGELLHTSPLWEATSYEKGRISEKERCISLLESAVAQAPAVLVTDGVGLIAAERQRQVSVEGWTPGHDDEHTDSTIAHAAACYAYGAPFISGVTVWPWDASWWKPTPNDRVRELVKAGALIAAEIDRLQRKEAALGQGKGA